MGIASTKSSSSCRLSGGIDSSLVYWLARDTGVPLSTFTKVCPGIETIPLTVVPALQEKRRSPVGKNAYYRTMLQQAVTNHIPFRYVLNDVWFASAENMVFVKQTLQKDFVMPLKANRKVALSAADKQHGRYVRVATLELEPHGGRRLTWAAPAAWEARWPPPRT